MKPIPKILIVDDEPVIRQTLEGLLSVEDVELLMAQDGEEGLALAREHQPDAILLDVMMPGQDGYETCRQIRATPALAEIPIIMITALDDRASRLNGLRAGADDFLTKPFDGIEIQIRLKNIIRLNRYRNLVAERSRFFWVVEHDDQGYLLLDDNGNIEYANPRAREYFYLPESYQQLNFTRQAERHYRPYSGAEPSDNVGVSYLVQPETVASRAFWLRVEDLDSSLAADNQRLVRVTDVTDQMSTRQDIRKFHSVVAHKLRTPVLHIYAGMALLDELDSMPPEEIKSVVGIAKNGIDRLIDEVRDVLQFIDAPMALDKNAPTTLAELTDLTTAAGKSLGLTDLSLSLPAELADAQLSISSSALELVVYEILENSRKFHPDHTPQVVVQVQRCGDKEVELTFLDDGQHMTAEQFARAKTPYGQAEKWFTGETPGMGLGIPLVTSLIWQAGGQVRLNNHPDRPGICVRLVLPLA